MLTTLKLYISSKFTWQFSNLVHLFDMREIKYNEHFVTNFQSMFFSLFNKNYITNPYCTCYYIMESMFVCLLQFQVLTTHPIIMKLCLQVVRGTVKDIRGWSPFVQKNIFHSREIDYYYPPPRECKPQRIIFYRVY